MKAMNLEATGKLWPTFKIAGRFRARRRMTVVVKGRKYRVVGFSKARK
jgi:hypothetical protein